MKKSIFHLMVAALVLVPACDDNKNMYDDGDKVAVTDVAVTDVTLNKTTLTLGVDGKQTLTAKVVPDDATTVTVTWSSDKTDVATVSPTGEVTAIAEGTATITVKTDDGDKMATCVVTIIAQRDVVAVTDVTLNMTRLTLEVDRKHTLTANVVPYDATTVTVTWSSDKTDVATVSHTGEVTAIAEGTAIITVKTDDGDKIATCAVRVIAPEDDVTEGDFFYYFAEKVFYQQNTERILLKAEQNFPWGQINSLLNDPAIMVSVAHWTERTPFILLIDKDNKPIPLATFEFFKAMSGILSVSYVYQYVYNHELRGPYLVIEGAQTDEFAVKLKGTTSLAQLQELAQRNNCTVGEKDPFVENQYNLYLSKTSELDVIQMSKLFYKTRLFEFSSPNFHIISGHPLPSQIPTPYFYYYYGVKMYLQQVTNQMLLTFAPNANREKVLGIIRSNPYLQPMSGTNFVYYPENPAIRVMALETKNGEPISSATFESFKAQTEVVAVSYFYKQSRNQGGQALAGFTDEIIVLLKGTTSYEQLQEFAERYNCTVGEENQFTKNKFMLYVSKTSNLDVLQTSNLFEEIGFFKWAQPNFYNIGW